jgi:hypothetical protein
MIEEDILKKSYCRSIRKTAEERGDIGERERENKVAQTSITL